MLRVLCLSLTMTLAAAGAALAADPKPELEPLALEAGVWDAQITFPSGKDDVPPTLAKGVQVNRLRSDGMWMLNEFHVEGTPYEGTGTWGWDAATKRYIGVWVDNNAHRMRQDVGYWDAKTKTMHWRNDMVGPDGTVLPMRMTEVFMGDKRTFEIAQVGPRTGKEVILVRMEFTRRPEAKE
jgi:hypothetical protein